MSPLTKNMFCFWWVINLMVVDIETFPEEGRKARKAIKFTDIVDESRLNIRKNLADDFLKSGWY
jgi:hypothetical protein